jgi:hypothetical protein
MEVKNTRNRSDGNTCLASQWTVHNCHPVYGVPSRLEGKNRG